MDSYCLNHSFYGILVWKSELIKKSIHTRSVSQVMWKLELSGTDVNITLFALFINRRGRILKNSCSKKLESIEKADKIRETCQAEVTELRNTLT